MNTSIVISCIAIGLVIGLFVGFFFGCKFGIDYTWQWLEDQDMMK